jgi:anti-sigma factor (TIGR02949 family)
MNKIKAISCEDAIRHLLEYLDHECENHTHEEIDRHLSACQACYSRMEFEKRLRSQIKNTGGQTVPNSLKNRIDKLFSGGSKD